LYILSRLFKLRALVFIKSIGVVKIS